MSLFPLFLLSMGKPVIGYYMNVAGLVSMLVGMKFFGHYRIPMYLTALTGYFLMYEWIKDSGLIYSANAGIVHIYLVAAIWADKEREWLFAFSRSPWTCYQQENGKKPYQKHLSKAGRQHQVGRAEDSSG